MKINFNGRAWVFREIDVIGMTEHEVQKLAYKTGRIQYEPNGNSWLVVKGIGYGCPAEGIWTLQDGKVL